MQLRVLVLRAALSLAPALSLGGCGAGLPPPRAPLDGFPLDRLDRVDAGVLRSAQPTREQLAALQRRYGIRTVLKLNRGVDEAPPGVRVLHRQLDAMVEPSPATLARIVDELERAERPVLVHCTHGEDRTGLVVALYRMRHGLPVDEAYADMIRHRFHRYPGVWLAWRRAEAAARQNAALAALAARAPARLPQAPTTAAPLPAGGGGNPIGAALAQPPP